MIPAISHVVGLSRSLYLRVSKWFIAPVKTSMVDSDFVDMVYYEETSSTQTYHVYIFMNINLINFDQNIHSNLSGKNNLIPSHMSESNMTDCWFNLDLNAECMFVTDTFFRQFCFRSYISSCRSSNYCSTCLVWSYLATNVMLFIHFDWRHTTYSHIMMCKNGS